MSDMDEDFMCADEEDYDLVKLSDASITHLLLVLFVLLCLFLTFCKAVALTKRLNTLYYVCN